MDLTPGKKFLELEPPQNRPAPKPWCHVQYGNNTTVEKLSIILGSGWDVQKPVHTDQLLAVFHI